MSRLTILNNKNFEIKFITYILMMVVSHPTQLLTAFSSISYFTFLIKCIYTKCTINFCFYFNLFRLGLKMICFNIFISDYVFNNNINIGHLCYIILQFFVSNNIISWHYKSAINESTRGCILSRQSDYKTYIKTTTLRICHVRRRK